MGQSGTGGTGGPAAIAFGDTAEGGTAGGTDGTNGAGGAGGGCTPNWRCGEWEECKVKYDIDTILSGNIVTLGKQTRTCTDVKACTFETTRIEEQECTKRSILLTKEEACFVNHTLILDADSGNIVARIRAIFTGKPRVDIDIGDILKPAAEQKYCWYCSNGIKDYDEEGIDCGGKSCPSCTFAVQITKAQPKKDYSLILYWVLIIWLALIALFLIWLESRNIIRGYLHAKLNAVEALIKNKRYDKRHMLTAANKIKCNRYSC